MALETKESEESIFERSNTPLPIFFPLTMSPRRYAALISVKSQITLQVGHSKSMGHLLSIYLAITPPHRRRLYAHTRTSHFKMHDLCK